MHDLLLARGGVALPQSHGLRACVERHKGRLSSELTLARLRRKAPSLEVLKAQVDKAAAGEEANYPRWVRVNALKSTLEEQLETTFSNHERAHSIQDVVTKEGKFIYIDPHVPNLVAVTSGIDLTKTDAYASGKVILQDKASCFPAYLLDPRSEDGDVVDACSAPGNKTTHLAAIMHEHQPEFETEPQTIYAFEKDSRRAQTLEKMVKVAGSKKTTRIGFGQDFLQVNPKSEKFKNVGALLLDPSCSGSGIVGRDSMPEVHLPEQSSDTRSSKGTSSTTKAANNNNNRKRKHEEVKDQEQDIIRDDDGNETVIKSEKDLEARLEALSSFQLTLLLHAFHFPRATKVTYSTCSVHVQENEQVVMRALESKVGKARGWRIMRREDQVSGMKEWPVRGLVEACKGDAEVADGCIRSYKGDGRGVMGFFVAGFVRDVGDGDGDDDKDGDGESGEGPYLRDDSGKMVRDVMGMPVLRSTGQPVSLQGRDVSDSSDDSDSEMSDGESGDEDGGMSGDSGDSAEEEVVEEEEDEWDGIDD